MSEAEVVNTQLAEGSVQETPVVENVVAKPTSNQLLDLSKREATFRKQEVAYKAKLAEAEEQLKELQYFRGAKDTYKDNPEQLLSKLGITYEELTKNIIQFYENEEANKKQPSVDEIRKEIAKEFEQRESQKVFKEQEHAILQFQNEIKSFIKDNGESFPHLTKLGHTLAGSDSTDAFMFQVIGDYFNETGELLDLQTAAESAEAYFQEEWQKLNSGLGNKKASIAETPAQSEQVAPSRAYNSNNIPDIVATSPRANKFRERTLSSPSLNNSIPVNSPVSFKTRRLEREELINKAIQSYEQVARVKK